MKFDEIKDKWDNPREKAKIQLILFLIFIVFAVVFIRLTPSANNNNMENAIINPINNLSLVSDNYNYKITISMDTNDGNIVVLYGGIRYENEMIISKNINDQTNNYYVSDDEYYIYDNGNYLLTNSDQIYDMINADYLDVSHIKEYLSLGIRDGDTYLIKANNINPDINNEGYVTIEISIVDSDILLIMDYTNLLKNDNIINCRVEYLFSNINKVNSYDVNLQKYIEKN